MKYSDEQRIEKIYTTTSKMLAYLAETKIKPEDVLQQEPVRWTITTSLYNIGEQVYHLSDAYKEAHATIPWTKYRVSGIDWCTTMRIPIGV